MNVRLTEAQVVVINAALAYYQAAFESPAADDYPFGFTGREAATELRVAHNAREALWKQTPSRIWNR